MAQSFLNPGWHRIAGLKLSLKAGIGVRAQRFMGEVWYVLADPQTSQHYRFNRIACWFIAGLDGKRTVEEIWRDGMTALGDDALGQTAIMTLVIQLNNADLLSTGVVPLVGELEERRNRHEKARRAKMFRNPLAMTLPLFNPDRLLTTIGRLLMPVPGWFWLLVFATLVATGAILGVSQARQLSQSFSDNILSLNNLFVIAALVPLVKVWHELGHGLITRRFGGSVREFGVMLMAFYPMPYVDASASLAFPSKWRRMTVAAGGMMFELALAALAMVMWVMVEDSLFKAVLYNIIIICGVSTILINGNPLLRYDGYYMLCDVLECPNLATRSSRYWGQICERWLFGAKNLEFDRPNRREKLIFLIYAPLAFIYRVTVSVAIALFVAGHYLVVGVVLGLWSLAVSVLLPVAKSLKAVFFGERLRMVRGRAAVVTLAGLSMACGLLLVPVPLHTITEGVVWLPDEAQVRTGTGGFVTNVHRRSGESVKKGDPLLALSDHKLSGDLIIQQLKVEEATLRMSGELFADQAKLQLLRREVDDAMVALARLRERENRLLIRAPSDGTVVIPTDFDLDGRMMNEGVLVGHVTPRNAEIVRVIVTQANIDLVRGSTRAVAVRLADQTTRTVGAQLLREVPAASQELPTPILGTSGGGALAIDPKDENSVRTLERVFQFDIALAEPVSGGFGRRVHVRFDHQPESLAAQSSRRIRQLFLSQLGV